MHVIHSTHHLPAVLQLALLAIVPVILAGPTSSPRDIPLDSGWSSLGCVTDDAAIPTLTSIATLDPTNMMVGQCVDFCQGYGHIYAGVENGTYCNCGDVLSILAMNATDSDCNVPCSGNSSEMCGGSLFLNLYWSGAPPPPPATMVQTSPSGLWNLLGCYNDSNSNRILETEILAGDMYSTSVESCTGQCSAQQYTLAGMEMARQCFCGNAILNSGVAKPSQDCLLPCSGNQSELCGGPNHITIYSFNGTT